MSINKFTERAELLSEMASGLCCRMYKLKSTLDSETTIFPCLWNPEWSSIRKKAEKYFPDTPEVSKMTGDIEGFLNNGDKTIADLTMFHDIILDFYDFSNTTKQILCDVPLKINEFKLACNRNIIILYLNLLRSYIRCFMVLNSISKRKTMMALLNTCNMWKYGSPLPQLTELNHTLLLIENMYDHFAETFYGVASSIKCMVLQFKYSIDLYYNTDTIRNKYILNPSSSAYAHSGSGVGGAGTGTGGSLNSEMSKPPSHFKIEFKAGTGVLNYTAPLRSEKQTLNDHIYYCGTSSYVSMYPELMDAADYGEYVIYCFIACPSLLFTGGEACLNLLRDSSTQLLFVSIYRDILMNVHYELEQIYLLYTADRMTTKDKIPLPKSKEFKWKSYLKANHTTAASKCGSKHCERRQFLIVESAALVNLIRYNPGIIAPKFPILLAIGAMIKAELLFYYSHVNCYDEVRRDARKYIDSLTYESVNGDVSKLLTLQMELISLIYQHYQLIQCYYKEYVCRTDAKVLDVLISQNEGYINTLGPAYEQLMTSFLVDINNADSGSSDGYDRPNEDSSSVCSPMDGKPLASSSLSYSLLPFRLNWNRVNLVLSTNNIPTAVRISTISSSLLIASSSQSNSVNINMPPPYVSMNAFIQRMNEVSQRTRFIDDLGGLIKSYLSVHELWWYSSGVMDSFLETICFKDVDSAQASARRNTNPYVTEPFLNTMEYVGGYFAFPALIHYNVTRECPEEMELLGISSTIFFDNLLSELCVMIMDVLKVLENEYLTMEKHCNAHQAAVRLQKLIVNRRQFRGGGGGADPLPGYESEVSARSSISTLIEATRHISGILASVGKFSLVGVYDRKYDVMEFVKKKIHQYVETRLMAIMFEIDNNTSDVIKEDTHSCMSRPTDIIQNLVTCCHAMELALNCIDNYTIYKGKCTHSLHKDTINEMLRVILYKHSNMVDLNLNPPGTAIPLEVSWSKIKEENANALIVKVVSWFRSVVLRIIDSKGDDAVVWVPSKKCFARVKSSKNPLYAGTDSIGCDENYLNETDMAHLCSLIGIQGVRLMELMLFEMMDKYLQDIKTFLHVHKEQWRKLSGFSSFAKESESGNKGSYSTVHVLNASKLPSLEKFHNWMISVGIILNARSCLFDGLLASQKLFIPYLHKITSSIAKAVDNGTGVASSVLESVQYLNNSGAGSTWGSGESKASYMEMASSGIDISLVNELFRSMIELHDEDTQTHSSETHSSHSHAGHGHHHSHGRRNRHNCSEMQFYLYALPIACGLTFITPHKWDNLPFSYNLEAFHGNEHCIGTTLWKFIQSLSYLYMNERNILNSYKNLKHSVEDAEVEGAALNAKVEGLTLEQQSYDKLKPTGHDYDFYQQTILQSSKLFLKLSVNIQLDLRCFKEAQVGYKNMSMKPMSWILEYFIQLGNPVLLYSLLEQYMPYSMLKSNNQDISMGKLKTGDPLVHSLIVSNESGHIGDSNDGGMNRDEALAML